MPAMVVAIIAVAMAAIAVIAIAAAAARPAVSGNQDAAGKRQHCSNENAVLQHGRFTSSTQRLKIPAQMVFVGALARPASAFLFCHAARAASRLTTRHMRVHSLFVRHSAG